VEDEAIRDDLLDALERCLADTANSWELHGAGKWVRRSADDRTEARNVHEELMVGHAARAAEGPAPA
jgi:hypothetical protein